MKKRAWAIFFALITLLSIIPATARALEIEGWWRARMTIDEGDFTTGAWFTLQASAKKVSYIYIFHADEYSYSGIAYLIIWSPGDGKYISESYSVYKRNNIVVLTHVPGFDSEGNLTVGSTIVFRLFGTPNYPTALKGYYTLFDIETASTPEQFVRMGPVHATPVDPALVPADVHALIPNL